MSGSKRIDNYSFLTEEGAMIDIEKTRRPGQRLYVSGRYTDDWVAIFTGENRTLSLVKQKHRNTLLTSCGVCELGEPSTDYQEFLNATRNGIPAVANWNIFGSKERYFLTADIFPQRKALGLSKVIYQEGNFLTIQRRVKLPSDESIWGDPEKIFVCWNSMSEPIQTELWRRGKIADISEYEAFNGLSRCRPKLLV